MTMRFREMTTPALNVSKELIGAAPNTSTNNQPKTAEPSTSNPQPKTANPPKINNSKPIQTYQFDGKTYATIEKTKVLANQIASLLAIDFPNAKVDPETAKPRKGKLIPAIRIKNALPKDQVKQLLSSSFPLTNADTISRTVTDTYQASTYQIVINDVIYTVILAGKGGQVVNGTKRAEVGGQQLRPDKLGLSGVTTTKSQLIPTVKSSLVRVVGKDPLLLNALQQLVDVAAGIRTEIDANLADHISDDTTLKLISQDFGEILTPIMMANDDNDLIDFPLKSNERLIDVNVKGQPVSVKSLGGSGNSFAVIQDLIDEYEAEIAKTPEEKNAERDRLFDIIKQYKKVPGKTTTDNLIRVAQKAQIPEVLKLNELLGGTPNSYKELYSLVDQFVKNLDPQNQLDKKEKYKTYLQAILPISTAGNHTTGKKNSKLESVGMPYDWSHYINGGDIEGIKNPKSSGRKYFDADFVSAAADQLSYLLGACFTKTVTSAKNSTGKDAEAMGNLITTMMTRKNATAAKISIGSNGSLRLIVVPFTDLKFGYQYHAGTNRPAQNAPGFTIFFN